MNSKQTCCKGCGILDAYEQYDADPRVNGPDDFDSFFDALVEHIDCGAACCMLPGAADPKPDLSGERLAR